uniref:PAPS_reduct domain-containing protein n=1 Tax=Globodera pallida TaxID=36090 RepID=A0A183CF98_GLOPA
MRSTTAARTPRATRVAIDWCNTPEEAAAAFKPEWFQGDGVVRRKNLPIEFSGNVLQQQQQQQGHLQLQKFIKITPKLDTDQTVYSGGMNSLLLCKLPW